MDRHGGTQMHSPQKIPEKPKPARSAPDVICASCVWCDKWDTTRHNPKGFCTSERHMVDMGTRRKCEHWRKK